jgi:hypothetical protein
MDLAHTVQEQQVGMIEDCVKGEQFLDPTSFIVVDGPAESQMSFFAS